ncbi:MAG: hypothetical protein AB7F31_05760 [Parachlamydiales bacterium]
MEPTSIPPSPPPRDSGETPKLPKTPEEFGAYLLELHKHYGDLPTPDNLYQLQVKDYTELLEHDGTEKLAYLEQLAEFSAKVVRKLVNEAIFYKVLPTKGLIDKQAIKFYELAKKVDPKKWATFEKEALAVWPSEFKAFRKKYD